MKKTFFLVFGTLVVLNFATITNALGLNLYSCKELHEIDVEEKKQLSVACEKIIHLIKAGKIGELYENSHSIMKKSVSKDNFIKSFLYLTPRLEKAQNITINDARIVTFKLKAANESKVVFSGSANPESSNHIEFHTVPDIKKQGLIFYSLKGENINRLLTFRVGYENKDIKLIGIHINPSKFGNRDADYYEQVGDTWGNEKRYKSSFIAYLTALRFCSPGQGIFTSRAKRLYKKVNGFLTNPEIKANLLKWNINDLEYQIIKYDTLEAISEIAPTLAYISKKELSENETPDEAKTLLGYLEKSNPEFGKHFEAIMFVAYTENPISPKKLYQNYRVPLKIN